MLSSSPCMFSRLLFLVVVSTTLLLSVTVSVQAFMGDKVDRSAECLADINDPQSYYPIPYLFPPTIPAPPFGHEMLPLFQMSPGFINFNSGSFGGPPRMVTLQQRAWADLAESHPDPWFRGGYQAVTRQVRQVIADFVNANASDLVLTDNTSGGINSILKSLTFPAGSQVLVLDTLYDMVQNVLAYVGTRDNITTLTAKIQYPIVDETSFTDPIKAAIQSAAPGSISMCVFSHISCEPSVILPIEALTTICKSIGARVLIDGAHAVGQIPVDLTALSELGVDYYAANGQKWLYGAKSTAFMWANSDNQQQIVPAIMSNQQNFVAEFEYTGTRDYTCWASLNATFNFRSWIGDAALMNYIKTTADAGANYLVDLWGTELGAPLNMTHALVNIRLPTSNGTLVWALTHTIAREYNMEVVVFMKPTGVFWTRLSTQIYTDMSDYEFLGQTLLTYFNVSASEGGRGTRFEKSAADVVRELEEQARNSAQPEVIQLD